MLFVQRLLVQLLSMDNTIWHITTHMRLNGHAGALHVAALVTNTFDSETLLCLLLNTKLQHSCDNR
jgi:hypothetical protein